MSLNLLFSKKENKKIISKDADEFIDGFGTKLKANDKNKQNHSSKNKEKNESTFTEKNTKTQGSSKSNKFWEEFNSITPGIALAAIHDKKQVNTSSNEQKKGFDNTSYSEKLTEKKANFPIQKRKIALSPRKNSLEESRDNSTKRYDNRSDVNKYDPLSSNNPQKIKPPPPPSEPQTSKLDKLKLAMEGEPVRKQQPSKPHHKSNYENTISDNRPSQQERYENRPSHKERYDNRPSHQETYENRPSHQERYDNKPSHQEKYREFPKPRPPVSGKPRNENNNVKKRKISYSSSESDQRYDAPPMKKLKSNDSFSNLDRNYDPKRAADLIAQR